MAAPDDTAYALWAARARAQAVQPPTAVRDAFWLDGECVGSVLPQVMHEIAGSCLSNGDFVLLFQEHAPAGWHLRCPPAGASAALNALAAALARAGRCGPWRHEQLAVWGGQGERLATVERGAVRVLGLATQAVHLVGTAPEGSVWVQQRAFTKPNDPGLWDTLMGGMVAASDSLEQAVARETREEAGLAVEALQALRHGGHVDFARPSDEGGGAGYMRERIDWFHATVPAGVEPQNQDGEVERFECWPVALVRERMVQGWFTLEAALVLDAWMASSPPVAALA